ncbi:hypothetical protein Rhopal_002338-T1 [Rhodotorula paludigena]|uniref:D-isomer specific 2-hydroxyacid dehydrogenase NAD-binding domain-containing protein n=1 Tax=Rhodotorula paludigena TaxID=86838 RepID=A0AAV5GGP7_9BASI|nr:hypothetical protein Rhopal_002338-T1 [Rhodotorula paludigena]
MPQSALLLPPHYGRPSRPSSPDVLALVAYVAYLVWAFLPEEWLEAIGIEWYPARDWALLVPAWIVMLVVYIYTGYFALNLYSTPPLDSVELLDDPRAFVSPPPRPPPSTDGKPRPPTPLWAHALLLPDDAIPPLYDLPMDVVNRVLVAPSRSFETALVTVPLPPPILDQLRAVVPDIRYRPYQGPDGTAAASRPTSDDYAAADAVLAWEVPHDLRSVEQTPKLKLWQGYMTGYTNVTESAYFRSVRDENELVFANLSGVCATNIGEHILGSVLTLTHKIHTAIRVGATERRWVNYSEIGGFFMRELNEMTVGIMGYGHIGKPAPETGHMLANAGDPDGSIPSAWYSTADRTSTLEFLARCDVLVNVLPDSTATRGFIGREELKAMKGNAIYVNVGRGTTTDQEALIEALQMQKEEGEEDSAPGSLRIGAAALDVVTPEPLPSASPLWSLSNAIVTMHWSGATTQYYQRALDVLLKNIRAIDAGQPPVNVYRGKGIKP